MAIYIKNLEKILKGAANHWRLKILFLLEKEPNLSLSDITDRLEARFKTIAQHAGKLSQSDLVEKRYRSRTVLHSLSPLGIRTLSLIKRLL